LLEAPGGVMAATTHYERLSALDASFLEIEDESSHMHVAVALLFDEAPLQTAHGSLDMERIRAYIESRLHLIPRYRQRLAYIPIEGHPVWVDDQRFNLFYHVRHSALPRPGAERQLKRLCGRILSQKLDRTKPLWEIWVVEGVEGARFALVAKVHHAMVDGISGMDLLTAVLSPGPTGTFEPAPPWQPRPAPIPRDLLLGELRRRAAGVTAVVGAGARAMAEPLRSLAAAWEGGRSILETLGPGSWPASPTLLNQPIGPHRRFDWLRMSLDDVKSVKNSLGGTVNDVVLATVVGGARRFLETRGARLDGLDFRAMVPVSLRDTTQRGQLGNRVANFIATLPIGERDAVTRYRRVVEATVRQKQSRAVQGAELIESLGDWTATAVLSQLIRLATRRLAYNVVVTNVPGPQIPLFLLEAPLRETYPMVPLFQNQAVGVALFSYAGGLFWGLNADWDAIPDLHDLAHALHEEFGALCRLAGSRAFAA
jgi:diacylglycerol O-acyltransferase